MRLHWPQPMTSATAPLLPFWTTPQQWLGATRLPPPLPVLRVTSFVLPVSSSTSTGTCHKQFYIPGPANHLADVALRRFDLSNDALLAFLDSVASHTQPWQMLHLPPIWLSRLTTDLQRRRHVWPSLASMPPPKIVSGPNTGYLSPMSSAWTPFLQPWKTRYPSSTSWRTKFGTGEPAAVVNRSGLSEYMMRSWPS